MALSKRMKIGIDLDDTINNLVEVWLSMYNKDYSDNVLIEDIKTWDIDKYVKCGTVMYSYLGNGSLFKLLSANEYVRTSISELMKENDVYIITANASYNSGVCDDKVKFIKWYFPFFPIENLMFVNNKQMINVDILIDDGLHNLIGERNYYSIVFDRPWNRFYPYMKRINGWGNDSLDTINDVIKKLKLGYEWNEI